VGELARVTEVHSVRRTVDHRDTQVGRRQAADLLYPPQRRHERVASADHDEHIVGQQLTRDLEPESAVAAGHDGSPPGGHVSSQFLCERAV